MIDWSQMKTAEDLAEDARKAAVPQSITRAQGKVALISAGLWPQVEAFVASIEDPTERALAMVALHDTNEWRRDSPFLMQCAAQLGLSDARLDELFTAAALFAS